MGPASSSIESRIGLAKQSIRGMPELDPRKLVSDEGFSGDFRKMPSFRLVVFNLAFSREDLCDVELVEEER